MNAANRPELADPIAIDGLINFRDIGGAITADGQRVQPGLVFRSDSLDALSEQAEIQLAELGVQRVIDLRSAEEVAIHGHVEAANIEWLHHSIGAAPSTLRTLFSSGQDPMSMNYRLMTTDYAPDVIRVLQSIADSQAPLVVHCTSGKDRTGLVSALIQLTLGVSNEIVLADYSASSHNVADHVAVMTHKYPKMAARLSEEQLLKMAGTDPAWLALALAPIDAAGGAERWLNERSGSGELAAQLRQRLIAH